jgi:topoisomerase IA-like protein
MQYIEDGRTIQCIEDGQTIQYIEDGQTTQSIVDGQKIHYIEDGRTIQLPNEKWKRTNNDLQSTTQKLKIVSYEPIINLG